MKKRELYFYVAFLVGGLLVGSGFTLLMTQPSKYEPRQWCLIAGTLVDSKGEPIPYQYVELWGLGFGAITARSTDVNGHFRLYANLRHGQMVNLVIRQNGRIYIGLGGTITIEDQYTYLGQVTFRGNTSITINR